MMTEGEKMVWAATFAKMYIEGRKVNNAFCATDAIWTASHAVEALRYSNEYTRSKDGAESESYRMYREMVGKQV